MTLKEYLKVKFEDDLASLGWKQKIKILLTNFLEFLRTPIPKSDLMC